MVGPVKLNGFDREIFPIQPFLLLLDGWIFIVCLAYANLKSFLIPNTLSIHLALLRQPSLLIVFWYEHFIPKYLSINFYLLCTTQISFIHYIT